MLVGPSGCGKSTLLRLIAGLEKVTAGRVRIGDRDVTAVAPPDRDIAMVFQNYALYPHMTVRENLAFGLRQRRTPRDGGRRARVGALAAMLGLERAAGAPAGAALRRPAPAGRDRARAGARAAAFLLDEPLSNLDAKLRTTMRSELARLHERLGVTTVYVTHDQVEAMTLGDRVAVLRDGVVQQFDVAAGAVPAAGEPVRGGVHRLAADEPRRRAACDGERVTFAGHVAARCRAGVPAGEVVLGLRPGAFALDGPRAEPDWPRMDG